MLECKHLIRTVTIWIRKPLARLFSLSSSRLRSPSVPSANTAQMEPTANDPRSCSVCSADVTPPPHAGLCCHVAGTRSCGTAGTFWAPRWDRSSRSCTNRWGWRRILYIRSPGCHSWACQYLGRRVVLVSVWPPFVLSTILFRFSFLPRSPLLFRSDLL